MFDEIPIEFSEGQFQIPAQEINTNVVPLSG